MNLIADHPNSGLQAVSAAPPLVSLSGVTVRRGDQTILANIDLTLAPGEILTVIGPHGGGKTMLLPSWP